MAHLGRRGTTQRQRHDGGGPTARRPVAEPEATESTEGTADTKGTQATQAAGDTPATEEAEATDQTGGSAADDTSESGYGPGPAVERREPDSPTDLSGWSWLKVLRGTAKEFQKDQLSDRAAALTYYSILSLFPALLVLVSLLGLAGKTATDKVLANLTKVTPGSARDVITHAVRQLQGRSGLGSIMAVVGVVLAVWSASGYVAAFIRTANAVYDMPEGRPVWKVLPVRVGVTVAMMLLAVASALIVVFTGSFAHQAGTALGVGDTGLTVWSIAKWPVLVVLVALMISILYWAAPNARTGGFRWISPGSFLALLLWVAASAGFAVYVASFASYNKTYGAFAGVVVFLVWLWITNLAIVLGLEFDAETARRRAVAGGYPADGEPYVEPRDTRKFDEQDRRRLAGGEV